MHSHTHVMPLHTFKLTDTMQIHADMHMHIQGVCVRGSAVSIDDFPI